MNLPKEADDKPDPKLAVYQVHRLAEKILALRSVRAKAFEIARLASVLWKQGEPHARLLFEKALNLTIANGNDPEARAISALHRRVITLIARSDAEWAKRLMDSAAKRESGDERSKAISDANLRTALGLLQDDSPVAVQFAERSLRAGIPWGFLDFIQTLRKESSEAEAYLKQLEVPIRELRYVSLSDLGIKNVPTLAILDRNGVVTDMWVGDFLH